MIGRRVLSGIAVLAILIATGCASHTQVTNQEIVTVDVEANVDKETVVINEALDEVKWLIPPDAKKMSVKFLDTNQHSRAPDLKCKEKTGHCYLRRTATAGKGRGCKDSAGNDARECRYEYVVKVWPKDGGPPVGKDPVVIIRQYP